MGSRILDGEDFAKLVGYTSAEVLRAVLAGQHGWLLRLSTETVAARVDTGRWVADCPYCAGSEVVSKTAPLFLCQSCGLAADGGRMRVVTFPANITAVEASLADLIPSLRFWTPS